MTRLLTAREAAESLGLVPETILNWARTGQLPSIVLPSGQVRISEDDLLAWLEERRRGSRPRRLTVASGSKQTEEGQHG